MGGGQGMPRLSPKHLFLICHKAVHEPPKAMTGSRCRPESHGCVRPPDL